MRTRLALVACRGATKGPWLRARGNETGVRIQALGQGERIVLVEERSGDLNRTEFNTAGTFPLNKGWNRLRFDKQVNGGICEPTQVELIIE